MQELLVKVTAALMDAQEGNLSTERTVDVLSLVKVHLADYAAAEEAKPKEQRKARRAQIKQALDSLSVSEEEALAAIADHIDEAHPSLIVASKIADAMGFTRSIIVNALRKLESAGIVKVRSLGMKGSRIETLIPGWGALVKERLAA